MGTSSVDIAYEAIREDVITGVRKPGERLQIERLSKIYDVGLTPLRESLQRLAADGIVIANGRRGFMVPTLHINEFIDLNIARTAVETAALRLSIQNGDDEWEAGVVAAAYSLEKQDFQLIQGNLTNFERWKTLNSRFHTALVEACGSSWLLKVRASLHDQCDRYLRLSIIRERMYRNLHEEHQEITKAVLARDVETACSLVSDHMGRTAEGLIRFFDDSGISASSEK